MTLVLGCDTDNFDGPVSVAQYQRFYNNGGRFCIVGCQTGTDNKNYTRLQMDNARAAGLQVPFLYEFLYWDGNDFDRMKHAASFGLPVAIDCEWQNGMPGGAAATVQRIQDAKALLQSLNAYWGIYTGAWWWPGNTGNSTAFAGDPLWHAAYPYGEGKLPPQGFLPDFSTFQPYGGWTKPTVQQFADVCYDEPTWDMNAMEVADVATEHYENELNDRRARDLLNYHLQNTLQLKATWANGQLALIDRNGQPVALNVDVPDWAAPN